MTTGNKIIVKSIKNATFVPIECVYAGADSIPYVFRKNKTRQVVIPGESNDKNMIIENGLEPGALIFGTVPANADKFGMKGEELIPMLRERSRLRKAELNAAVTRISRINP
jgi:hypothetical protein